MFPISRNITHGRSHFVETVQATGRYMTERYTTETRQKSKRPVRLNSAQA